MGYVQNFTSFTNGKNKMLSEETDVMLTDKTLVDLSAKVQQYKNQINQWERDIENRKKVLADETAKKQAAAAAQPAPTAPQPAPTA
jgi:uncharacterized protein YlxW (UPF0749 family)